MSAKGNSKGIGQSRKRVGVRRAGRRAGRAADSRRITAATKRGSRSFVNPRLRLVLVADTVERLASNSRLSPARTG